MEGIVIETPKFSKTTKRSSSVNKYCSKFGVQNQRTSSRQRLPLSEIHNQNSNYLRQSRNDENKEFKKEKYEIMMLGSSYYTRSFLSQKENNFDQHPNPHQELILQVQKGKQEIEEAKKKLDGLEAQIVDVSEMIEKSKDSELIKEMYLKIEEAEEEYKSMLSDEELNFTLAPHAYSSTDKIKA